MDGEAGLILTGQLGDVMKESGRIALSYVESHSSDLEIPARRSSGASIFMCRRGRFPRTAPRPA